MACVAHATWLYVKVPSLGLAQCFVYEFLHDGTAHSAGKPLGQTAMDEGNLEPFDAVVKNVDAQRDAFYLESAGTHTFCDDAGEELLLVLVEILAYAFHQNDVAEELCSEVAIALHGLLDHVKVSVDEFNQLVFWFHVVLGYLIHAFGKTVHFALNDGLIDFFLAFEIGVECAPPLARGSGDFIHCGVFESVFSKKQAGYIHYFVACLRCCHICCKGSILAPNYKENQEKNAQKSIFVLKLEGKMNKSVFFLSKSLSVRNKVYTFATANEIAGWSSW